MADDREYEELFFKKLVIFLNGLQSLVQTYGVHGDLNRLPDPVIGGVEPSQNVSTSKEKKVRVKKEDEPFWTSEELSKLEKFISTTETKDFNELPNDLRKSKYSQLFKNKSKRDLDVHIKAFAVVSKKNFTNMPSTNFIAKKKAKVEEVHDSSSDEDD